MSALATHDRPAACGEAAGVAASRVPTSVAALPPATPEVPADSLRRYVTQGRYGTIVIDVVGEAMYVNGEPVERAVGLRG